MRDHPAATRDEFRRGDLLNMEKLIAALSEFAYLAQCAFIEDLDFSTVDHDHFLINK